MATMRGRVRCGHRSAGAGQGTWFSIAAFSKPVPPPPFNWALTTSGVGLAERQPGGRLHAIFYGNVDGVLASQLVAMPAGTYRVGMQLVGTPVHAETLLLVDPLREVRARCWRRQESTRQQAAAGRSRFRRTARRNGSSSSGRSATSPNRRK